MDLEPKGKPIFEHWGPTPPIQRGFYIVLGFAFVTSSILVGLVIVLSLIFRGISLNSVSDKIIVLIIIYCVAFIMASIIYYFINYFIVRRSECGYFKIYENGIKLKKFCQGSSHDAPKSYEDLIGFKNNWKYYDHSSFIPHQMIKEIYPIYSSNKKKVWIIIKDYYWNAYPNHGFDVDGSGIENEIMDKFKIISTAPDLS